MSERRRAVVQWAVVGVLGWPGRRERACGVQSWAGPAGCGVLGRAGTRQPHGCRASTAYDSRTQSDGVWDWRMTASTGAGGWVWLWVV
eukprot:145784-Prymnesium_polylepis.1